MKPSNFVDLVQIYMLSVYFIVKQQIKLEIGCKQGFQYTPRKIIWSWPITS